MFSCTEKGELTIDKRQIVCRKTQGDVCLPHPKAYAPRDVRQKEEQKKFKKKFIKFSPAGN
jgi:hypothetical protein